MKQLSIFAKFAVPAAVLTAWMTTPLLAQDDLTPKVLDLLENRCQECHHPDTADDFPYLHKGVSIEDMIADEAIVPGNPEESPLYERIVLAPESRKRMPKSRGAEGDDSYATPLTTEEQEMIKNWIVQVGNKPAEPTNLTSNTPTEKPEETPGEPTKGRTPGQPDGKPTGQPTEVTKGQPTEVTKGQPEEKPQTPVATPEPPKVEVTAVEELKPDDQLPSGFKLEEKVKWIFEQRCSKCHIDDYPPDLHASVDLARFFKDTDNGGHLLAEAVVSRVLLDAHENERMPKSKGDPGDKGYRSPLVELEKEVLQKWVDSGRPKKVEREFVSNSDMIRSIYQDLEKATDSEKRFFRYLTLTNLYNAKDDDGGAIIADLDPHRAGIFKLINSLSMNARITRPVAIDEDETIYRIDLRDYNWTSEDWDRMLHYYPYGIIGIDKQKENLITEYTGSKMAYVRGDWFVFACGQPPLYNEMLYSLMDIYTGDKETDFVAVLEDKLGIDRYANLKEGNAMRAGFQFSGVSEANRLIERHEVGSWQGSYWISYDFTPLNAKRTQELKLAPLGPVDAGLSSDPDHCFDHDGGEIVFSLPNGLQGYLLATDSGKVLDRAPIEIVQDDTRKDSVILNGISCIACHSEGMKPAQKVADPKGRTLAGMKDEVRPLVEAADILNFQEKKLLEDLYPEPEVLQAAVKEDYERFAQANGQAIEGLAESTEPVGGLYYDFRAPVTANKLASEFGMEYSELIALLDKKSNESELLSVISSSMSRKLPIRREHLLREYMTVVYALGYELMEFEPLGYEDFGGSKYADLVKNSDQYLAAFGGSSYNKEEVVKKLVTSETAGANLSTESVLLKHGGKLKISIAPTYKVGDTAQLHIVATNDMYIRVFHFSSDEYTTELFPGKLGMSTFRPKNKKLEISWQTTKPGGAEHVIVYAAQSEIQNVAKGDKVGDFTVYKKEDVYGTRGIPKAIKATEVEKDTVVPAQITEARIGYILKD